MEDPDGTLASVAQCIEQLRQGPSSAQERENCLKQLLDLIEMRENAFSAVGSHSQAVPVLVSLLRSGSLGVKIQAATVLCSLCKENELRVKVLLGGCIPPLLGLLKSSSVEGQIAAAKTIYAVSEGGVKDHVGSKIFSTEGVVPVLWDQLRSGNKKGEVDGLLTGALKNLSSTTEGFWSETIRAGGMDVLVKLLTSGKASTVSNVCFLLACMMMEDASVCSSVLTADITKQLLKLLGSGNEASVRAEAAAALKSLSAQSKEAKREIANSNGIPILINATIAPSKEFMQGEYAQALQENAMCALANISGGLSYVISSLGQSLESCSSPAQTADTLGALASALMIYDGKAETTRASDPLVIEQTLLKQFKPRLPFLVQERTIEALASLYGNSILAVKLSNSDAKRLLVGLVTMAANEVQDELVKALLLLCNHEGSLWHALQGREGIQLLISLLGLSSEQQQECAVALLCLLSNENDESKWAITAAGGIPPLVQILETGSAKAREDSATILRNLCNHSEDILQQLAAELLSHLLFEEHLQKDPLTQHVIGPLIHVLGSGIHLLQQRAVKALVSLALTWPNEIAKEGGVSELSKVILQADPSVSNVLWESAASILVIILQFSSEFYLEVPVAVLVRLLRSASENTVVGALNTLLVLESDDGTSAESMAGSGAIEALLDLLRSHQCEDTAARLLEVLLNNVKIRDSKATKTAILPLSQYLLDPQTQAQQARLLATLALGDLFQNEALARSTDAASACRALVNVLEEQPTEEMKVVAICALQNLVMHSRSNKRAVAEAGGVQVVLDLISSSDPDTSVQAAMFVKLLFSNHTVQEYASSETVRAITAAIEKDLWASGTVNDEYLKALNSLFNNFPRLRATEPATLSIPHLVTSLKTGSEATQEAALDALFLLRQAWSACPAEVSRAQSVAAADAIPLLQYLIQSGPPRFQEKAEFLLQCLPGTLVVTIKRGNNMKQSVGNPSVFCKITLGNTPPRQTKVISTGPNPEWDESFSWSFESPPKGQKLHISCKNKSKMGKSSFGKVTIQIDRVVMLGAVAGEYSLLPESKSGPRNLEIEFQWSNK
ncbi:hypothetical protein F2Q69_00016423 [Brassica cretica]|uniref:C2 domain-containing protein n=1 Tax=Brassica cretica TaxID=69181 RepID=A0A8S9QX78_BRACR|nr:hypothetical protein F2Q69_00016423 [Brassica cretica]